MKTDVKILKLATFFMATICLLLAAPSAKAKVQLTPQLAKKIEQALKRELELGGLCSDANSDSRSFTSGYEPGVADPQTYVEVSLKEHNITSPKVINFSKIKIVQQPKHGRLATQIVNERNNEGYFNYIPNKGYWGKDNAIFEVAVNQFKIKVEYQFNVGTDDNPNMDACDPSYSWLNNEGTITPDFPSNSLDAYVAQLARITNSYSMLEETNITFRDTTGAAVGEILELFQFLIQQKQ